MEGIQGPGPVWLSTKGGYAIMDCQIWLGMKICIQEGGLQQKVRLSDQALSPFFFLSSPWYFQVSSLLFVTVHFWEGDSPSLQGTESTEPVFSTKSSACCMLFPKSMIPFSYVHAWVHAKSDSLWPHGLQPFRLLCPLDSPGKNTPVGCQALLQGIFPIQRLNLHLLCLLYWRQFLYH